MAFDKKKIDLTEGPFLAKIISFVIPVIISGLLQTFYNAADLAVVGSFRGELALAAVGSTGSINSLLVNISLGLSVGAGVVVAQQIGAREHDKVKKTVHSAILLAIISGVAVAIFGIIFIKQILSLMGTPETVIDLSARYLRIIFLGLPVSMLYNYSAAILRSAGDTRHPLIFLSVSGLANVVLNLFLVAVVGLGVEGVAIATVFSQLLSAVMVLLFMYRKGDIVAFSPKSLAMDAESVKRILVIGIPSGVQTCLFAFANVMIQSSINSFGDVAMAGNSAASNLEGFVHTSMVSLYQASTTFSGQNVGAKKYENLKRITFICLAAVTAVGLVLGGVLLLFKDFFIGLYADNPAVIDYASRRLVTLISLYFICGMMDVMSGVLRGMGKSLIAMCNSLLACVIRIVWVNVIFYIVPHEITWVYVSYPTSWIAVLTLHFVCYGIFYRRLLRKDRAEKEAIKL